jgi:hypothetical protein
MEAKDDERMQAAMLESSDLLLSSKMRVTKQRSHSVHPRDPRLETDTFMGGYLQMKPRRVDTAMSWKNVLFARALVVYR